MTIVLTPELDRLLNERLASGLYSSVEEVLTVALRSLREYDETIAAVREGNEDFLAGRCTSLEESDAAFRKRHGLNPFNNGTRSLNSHASESSIRLR